MITSNIQMQPPSTKGGGFDLISSQTKSECSTPDSLSIHHSSSKIHNVKEPITTNQSRKRAALYIRVSTDEQGEKFGPAYQKDEMLVWAAHNPLPSSPYIVLPQHIYTDIGCSGADDLHLRPALTKLFDEANKGEFDSVLVWKIDRFFRKNELLHRYIRELSELGIEFISVTQPALSTSGITGKLLLSVLGSIAEIERDQIIERTAAGKQAAARAGRWVGGKYPPYGYDIDKDRLMQINEEQAQVVRQVFQWFGEEKLSTYEIQKRLNLKNIPTKADTTIQERAEQGKKSLTWRSKNPNNFWGVSTIIKILNNEAYAGEYYYGKRTTKKDPATGKRRYMDHPREDWIALPCPAIVDRTLWHKVHNRLAHNKRFAKKNRLYEYLFSGKLVCGQCGSPYVGYMKKKSRKKKVIAMYGQYRCRRSSKAKAAQPCRNGHISERELDSKIWKQLYDFLSEPRQFLREMQQREAQAEGAVELRVKQQEIDTDLQRLQGEQDRVRFLYEKGIGYKSTQEVEERFAEIEAERHKLREQEKAISSRILTREQQRDRIQCAELLAERYKKVLDAADFQLKKQIINALVAKVTIHPSRVRVELRIEKPLTQEVKPVFAGKNEIQKPLYGAVERTRTSTSLRTHAPQARASTNFATTARGVNQ